MPNDEQVNEIVYAKWDESALWYLAQVISITEQRYNVLFMDGYTKDKLSVKELRKVPKRERNNKMIGKRFFDNGDKIDKRDKGSKLFKKGEFIVLCCQPGSGSQTPSYWCERETGSDIVERDIQEFGVQYVKMLVDEYENE